MNIAFIHTVFPGGGAERVTRDIAKGILSSRLSGEKYSFYVYTPKIRPELLTEDFTKWFEGIREYSFKTEEQELEKMIGQDGIDVVVQIAREVRGMKQIRENTGCKFVFANHGEPFHQRYEIVRSKQERCKNKLFWRMVLEPLYTRLGYAKYRTRRMCRKNYDHCDVYTVLCEEYKTQICRELGVNRDRSKIVAINNSEEQVAHVCLEKENIVLFSGRFEQFSKRIDRLLRIWKMAYEAMPEWKLILAGDGADLQNMEQMSEELGLKNIEFVGFQEDMSVWYRKASILCLTSQTEGWGLCLTEAQANGVIPIAFDCTAGVRHILSPSGVNGFLVRCFDEIEYASVLVKIASADEQSMMALRLNVIEKAKEYAPDVVAAEWKALFENLMK